MVLAALILLAALAGPPSAAAADDVVVVQESRTPERGRSTHGADRRGTVRHSALLKNTGPRPIRGLRVSVELCDYFGALLWARTVVPTPSSLEPGETASISLSVPDLEAYRKTRYRFEYRSPR